MPDDTVQPAAAPDSKAASTDAAIDKWFNRSFTSSALSRNTECWNLVFQALPDLKRAVAAATAKE